MQHFNEMTDAQRRQVFAVLLVLINNVIDETILRNHDAAALEMDGIFELMRIPPTLDRNQILLLVTAMMQAPATQVLLNQRFLRDVPRKDRRIALRDWLVLLVDNVERVRNFTAQARDVPEYVPTRIRPRDDDEEGPLFVLPPATPELEPSPPLSPRGQVAGGGAAAYPHRQSEYYETGETMRNDLANMSVVAQPTDRAADPAAVLVWPTPDDDDDVFNDPINYISSQSNPPSPGYDDHNNPTSHPERFENESVQESEPSASQSQNPLTVPGYWNVNNRHDARNDPDAGRLLELMQGFAELTRHGGRTDDEHDRLMRIAHNQDMRQYLAWSPEQVAEAEYEGVGTPEPPFAPFVSERMVHRTLDPEVAREAAREHINRDTRSGYRLAERNTPLTFLPERAEHAVLEYLLNRPRYLTPTEFWALLLEMVTTMFAYSMRHPETQGANNARTGDGTVFAQYRNNNDTTGYTSRLVRELAGYLQIPMQQLQLEDEPGSTEEGNGPGAGAGEGGATT